MRYTKGTVLLNSDRDIPLLKHVRNSKFVTHSQLFELLRSTSIEYSRESFCWRIRRLLHSNFIARCEGNFGVGESIYQITRRGLNQLESHGHFATVLNSHTSHLPPPVQIYHALELNQVRLALIRKNLLVYWKSDVEIASQNTVSTAPLEKDYDAIVDVWNNDQAARFALEYERTLKSNQHYARIRRALESENVMGCILYLTSGDELSYQLAHEFSGIPKRIGFATTQAFRQSLLDTQVMTFPGDPLVSFRSLLGGVF
jgi:hypothetical protein